MLRKREDNIFAHIRRQVHGVVGDQHLFLAFQGEKAGPFGQNQHLVEPLEAADALTMKWNFQTALDQKGLLLSFDFEVVLELFSKIDHLVDLRKLQFSGGSISL